MRPIVYCVVAVLVAGSACHKSKPPAPPAHLVFLTELAGVTEPCGCTSKPLGGLDYLAGVLQNFAAAGPLGLVIAGNTFFTYDPPPASLVAQETTKAQAIARILQRLQPLGIIPGPIDSGRQRPALVKILEHTPLPLLWQAISESTVTLGATPIGIIGIPEAALTSQLSETINQHAATLRQHGSSFVVAVSAIDSPDLRRQAGQLEGVNAMVLAGVDRPAPPQVVGHTVVLTAGSKGEYLGSIELHGESPGGADGGWTFYDAGAGQRDALDMRRVRLRDEAMRLPEGPARDARLAKVQELAKQRDAVSSALPQNAYFTWQPVVVDKTGPRPSWAIEALASYNRSLCAPALADSAKRTCTPAASLAERYVGTAACQPCHVAAVAVLEKTAHGHAWKTLTEAGKDCDLNCVSCHTVGFEKPGGFCHLADASQFANVGCENCHGPGGGHVDNPQDRRLWGSRFISHPGAAVCTNCHTPEHSDKFEFASYLPRIMGVGHGPADLQPHSSNGAPPGNIGTQDTHSVTPSP